MADSERQELTLQDFAALPLRALTALAVRCARRVFPALLAAPDSPQMSLAVDKATAALQLATEFATDQIIWLDQFAELGPATYQSAQESLGEGQYAVFAAGHAATAAALAQRLLRSHSADDAMEMVAAAWGAYRVLLSFVRGPVQRDVLTGEMVLGQAHADYDRLVAMGLGRFGTAGQPVDPGEAGPLGPLWPAGPPSWYP